MQACIELSRYLQRIVDKLKAKSPAKSPLKLATLRGYLASKPEFVAVLQRSAQLIRDMPSDEEEEATDLITLDCEQEFSPHEKLEYLKGISGQYWKYTTRQLIKLKQLRKIDSEATLDDSRNLSVCNDTTLGSRRGDFSSPKSYRSHQVKCYFEYSEVSGPGAGKQSSELDSYDLCDETEGVDELAEEGRQQDLAIQDGLLNLVLGCLEACERVEEEKSVF